MKFVKVNLFIAFSMFICLNHLFAAIKLPKIFSDNMVIQRDQPVKIWGWADNGEKITVNFNNQEIKTTAGKSGKWSVILKPMTFGGPFELKIVGKANNILLKNILIGDVWICSGQSNMEFALKGANNAQQEISKANYPEIRHFTVEKAMSYKPKEDFTGGNWQECNPENAGNFSAVAYFFGRKLNQELNIPIGLIHTSWGGTDIQTWISWDEMSQIGEYQKINLDDFDRKAEENAKKLQNYQLALKSDKGIIEKWFESKTDISSWKVMILPQLWEKTEVGNADGIIWFRKDIEVPASFGGKSITLSMGPIDDWDETYVNGSLVGKENVYNKPRKYQVTLKPGQNTIVIKVTDTGGGGGIFGKPEELYIECDGQKISLAGEWKYNKSVLSTDFGILNMGPNSFPSQLYNAMIAPVINFSIKGAIWYQGENNTWQAFTYRSLFPKLINNWRAKWGQEFPFYWVQLANFKEAKDLPGESDWAELREAQNMTLNLPKTGQAVITDIGDANDIHPKNKQDVGLRLALAALKTTYGKDIVYSGPVYQSMKIEGDKIVLNFKSVGGGLLAKNDKYGYLRGFSIAGEDKQFKWAKAIIEGDKVIVTCNQIKNPVAVRYAWADNPDDANLYNAEGLPASSFRTDNWKGMTEGK
jgi:sialate O-acetylesterase